MVIEHTFERSFEIDAAAVDEPDGWEELARALAQDVDGPPSGREDAAVPAGLDRFDPGLFTAAILASMDRSGLSGHDLVAVLRAEERLISHLQALQAQTIAQLVFVDPSDPDSATRLNEVWEDAAGEVGAGLHLTRRGAESRVWNAHEITAVYPQVGEALARGEFDFYRARIICDG